MKQEQLNRMIGALKPALLDSLADAAHDRRPNAAEVRARADASAMAASTAPSATTLRGRLGSPRRRALAGGALAMATLAVLLAVGVWPQGGKGGAGASDALDTRRFLLVSAEIAAQQPATDGSCWYSRIRTWQDLGADAFHARTASSTESWNCALPGGADLRIRTRGPLDIQVTFPTRADEAAWRAAGSPALALREGTTRSEPSTNTVDVDFHSVNGPRPLLLVIGSHHIDWQKITQLPTAESDLESFLRGLWQEDRARGTNNPPIPADFCQYAFQSAWSMYRTPTTPGTRAALYRLLAGCPSVHVVGNVTDRMGRSGVVIADHDLQLVVDEATAALLDVEEHPGQYLALERQGWVNGIDQLPTS
jgi:hypothetical protein